MQQEVEETFFPDDLSLGAIGRFFPCPGMYIRIFMQYYI